MNKIKNQRGVVFAEFAVAVPLLILLLYSLGSVSLSALKLSNEQVADYVLETEAQEIIDRITTDARAAYSIQIKKNGRRVIFICHTHSGKTIFEDVHDTRIYDTHTTQNDSHSRVYFKHADDETYNNPLTGQNFYGKTFIKQLKFKALTENVLHITLEMGNSNTGQTVKFSTAVFSPACEKIEVK